MSIIMYDAIYVSNLPKGAEAYAGYTGGAWPTYTSLPAAKYHLSIAVSARGNGQCLDVEPGDATVGQINGWFKRQRKRGVKRPCIYASASQMASVERTMSANGWHRSQYRLWSAHYTNTKHFCGPHSCGYGLSEVDATQYRAAGPWDASVCKDDFFDTHHTSKPAPKGEDIMERISVQRKGHISVPADSRWHTIRFDHVAEDSGNSRPNKGLLPGIVDHRGVVSATFQGVIADTPVPNGQSVAQVRFVKSDRSRKGHPLRTYVWEEVIATAGKTPFVHSREAIANGPHDHLYVQVKNMSNKALSLSRLDVQADWWPR